MQPPGAGPDRPRPAALRPTAPRPTAPRLTGLARSALVAAVLLAASPAAAQCYADYKASREPPLRLHYGVIALPAAACADRAAAAAEIARRIAREGWTLLDVVSLFGPEGLNRRQADAGDFFLRY